jgi:hypothetical protein
MIVYICSTCGKFRCECFGPVYSPAGDEALDDIMSVLGAGLSTEHKLKLAAGLVALIEHVVSENTRGLYPPSAEDE